MATRNQPDGRTGPDDRLVPGAQRLDAFRGGRTVVSRPSGRWRNALVATLLVIGSVTVGLAILEAVLRLFFSGHSPLFLDIYRLDEQGLLGLRPGITRRQVTP